MGSFFLHEKSGLTMGNDENLKQNQPPATPKPGAGAQIVGTATTNHHRLPDGSSNKQQQPPPTSSESRENETNKTEGNNFTDRSNTRGRGRGRGRGPFTRLKPHEKYQENQKILAEMFTNKYFKRYFIIAARSGCSLAEINVIKANKQMTQQLRGNPKKVTEMRDGSLLVEVVSEEQSSLIR